LGRVKYQSAPGNNVRDILTITTTDETGLSDQDEVSLRTMVAILAGQSVRLSAPEITQALAAGGTIRVKSFDATLLSQVSLKSGAAELNFEITAVNRWDGTNQPTTVVLEITMPDGRTSDLTIPIMVYRPKFEILSTMSLNPETSLYEQRVRVLNTTPFELSGLRLILPILPTGITLYTQHGTTSAGETYVEPPGRLIPAAETRFVLEFFSTNLGAFTQPNYTPQLTLGATGVAGQGIIQPIGRVVVASQRQYVEFPTQAGRLYWVQYRDSASQPWQTSSVALVGTGYTIQWLDDGWPKTTSAPTSARTYQLLVAMASAGTLEITAQPQSQQVTTAATATLTVSARSSATQPLSYQWYKDGVPVAGAVGSQLLVRDAGPGAVGDYYVVVSDGGVAVQSATAVLKIAGASSGRIVNLSVLATLDPSSTLATGFAIAGSPSVRILNRAIGPTLAEFNVPQAATDPNLQLYSGAMLASNEDWEQDIAGALVANVSQSVGAFALPTGSRDATLLRTLLPGSYTAHTTNRTTRPTAVLTEVYDAGSEGDGHLVNISSRSGVGRDGATLTAGFVVTGEQPVRVLIRGIGPSLAQFGVSDVLADPVLTLRDSRAAIVDTNDDWSTIETAVLGDKLFERSGAFDLPRGSRDAVLVTRLPAGAYTVTINAKAGASGQALVEVYVIE
jgi:hypothetical protein